MKQHPAWGVDVTSVVIRGVRLVPGKEGRPRLVAWDVVDFTEEVEDPTSLSRFSTLGRGLFHFLSRHALKRSRVWLSLRSETAFNRTVTVPPVTDESLDKILEYEAQQQVPFPLDEVYWDRRVLAIRENGEVLATLYAIRKALVEDRLRKLAKSNFPLDGIQLRTIALQNFCSFERLLEDGTIVVDVDYTGLQVLIHHDDRTWFRVLPVGGSDYVARLRETFECDHRTAVRMASGQTPAPDSQLAKATEREVAQDITDEVIRTVRYYLAACPDVKPSGVVLFESHPCVPAMKEALKRSLEMPVFLPRGFRHLDVDSEVVTAGIQEHFPSLMKSVGLALQGIGRAEVEVRLFPDTLSRPLGSRRAGYIVAFLFLLAVVITAGVMRHKATNELREASTKLEKTLALGQDREGVEVNRGHQVPMDEIVRLGAPARGRLGPLLAVEHVYRVRAASHAMPRPHVVSFRYGASAPDRVEVVLAVSEEGSRGSPVEALVAFAQLLEDGFVVKSVAGGREWVSGALSPEPPVAAPSAPLRHRFRQKVFVLTLAEDS